jgi:hypothetical protein
MMDENGLDGKGKLIERFFAVQLIIDSQEFRDLQRCIYARSKHSVHKACLNPDVCVVDDQHGSA